jgi:GxxExxY protein
VKQEVKKDGKFCDGSENVIGALLEVHSALGPGLLESACEACVCRELTVRRIPFERQVRVPILYKGMPLDCGYRVDVLVRGSLVVELKAVERLLPVHTAQVLTYLRLLRLEAALLVNFNVPSLRHGVRRLTLRPSPPS